MADEGIAHLTAGLASGDEAAFREFHARYFDRLYCLLLVIARGNEDDAAEALQQTLLRVARYARVFANEEVFWSWLKNLARSAARDAGRKRQRYAALLQRFSLFRSWSEAPAAAPDEHRLSDLLAEILSELPLDDRGLLQGKYLTGETVREIAERTGLTEKAVEGRLTRLRHQIRSTLIEKLREQ